MTMMGKANESGLEAIAKAVLAPHFHGEGVVSKKVRFPRLDMVEKERTSRRRNKQRMMFADNIVSNSTPSALPPAITTNHSTATTLSRQ